MRVHPEDVDRMEIYMFRLSNWISFRERRRNHAHGVITLSTPDKRYVEISLEQTKKIVFEISRLETFIEMYDSMVGGRGLTLAVKNIITGDIFTYGNYKVMSEVTEIDAMKIHNSVKRKSTINNKYLVKAFKYEEIVPVNQIDWRI